MILSHVSKRDNQLLIIILGCLFTALLVGEALTHNLLPLLLVFAVLPLDLILKGIYRMNINTRLIFYLILFFIMEEIVAGMATQRLHLNIIELAFLMGLNLFSIIRNKFKFCFSKKLITLWIVMIGFLFNDFIAIMNTYDSVQILQISLLSFCKYFLLVLFLINEQVSEDQVRNLL